MTRNGALDCPSYLSEDGREVGVDSRLLPVEADVADRVLLMLELARCRLHGGPAVLHLLVLGVRAAVEYLRFSQKLIRNVSTTPFGIKFHSYSSLPGYNLDDSRSDASVSTHPPGTRARSDGPFLRGWPTRSRRECQTLGRACAVRR